MLSNNLFRYCNPKSPKCKGIILQDGKQKEFFWIPQTKHSGLYKYSNQHNWQRIIPNYVQPPNECVVDGVIDGAKLIIFTNPKGNIHSVNLESGIRKLICYKRNIPYQFEILSVCKQTKIEAITRQLDLVANSNHIHHQVINDWTTKNQSVARCYSVRSLITIAGFIDVSCVDINGILCM